MLYIIKVTSMRVSAGQKNTRILLLWFLTAGGLAVSAVGQHGGKAEPNRVEFASGHSSATLSRSLGRDEEAEYVFAAVKGQKVTVRNSKIALFDVRLFSDEHNVETEFDSSPTFSLIIPETGDYQLFVRKKRVKAPQRAVFTITLTIK